MKTYIVNFFYTIQIKAKNAEEAEELAIQEFEANPPTVADCATETNKK